MKLLYGFEFATRTKATYKDNPGKVIGKLYAFHRASALNRWLNEPGNTMLRSAVSTRLLPNIGWNFYEAVCGIHGSCTLKEDCSICDECQNRFVAAHKVAWE